LHNNSIKKKKKERIKVVIFDRHARSTRELSAFLFHKGSCYFSQLIAANGTHAKWYTNFIMCNVLCCWTEVWKI